MIDQATIDTVRERTDIVALIGETMRLVKRGRSYVGLCPFHKEKTPSFHVNKERGRFMCFGCKESGDAIEFIVKSEGRSFREAVGELAARIGIEVGDDSTEEGRREAAATRRASDDLYAINALAATFFEMSLRGYAGDGTGAHPMAGAARAELARRGLGERTETEQAFRIGYAPAAWNGLVEFLKQQGASMTAAEKVGLVVPRLGAEGGFYDRFRHRLMFPVIDAMGRVVAFSGRCLAGWGDEADGAKYVNSPESPIYTKGEHLFGLWQGKQAIRQTETAILVEGNFDVVSLHARGISNAVAPLGTAFTSQQARLMKKFASKVVVMFDGDAAGKKATRAARGPISEAGLSAKVAALPTGADPDDYARTRGPEALTVLASNARGMLEYLIDEALGERFAESSLEEQRASIGDVAKILREERDPTLRSMARIYVDRIASKLTVGGRAMVDLKQLERAVMGDGRADTLSSSEAPTWRTDGLGLAIVGAIIDYPELASEAAIQASAMTLNGDEALALAAALKGSAPPSSLQEWVNGRMVTPEFESIAEARQSVIENAATMRRLEQVRRRRALVMGAA
jgi:DNA primase